MSSLNMFNMGGPQHRPNVNHRIPELLESLKAEFESLAHDVNVYKIQRDDYERTLQVQLSEITNIQNSIYELERRQSSIQQKYDEDLKRLHKDNQSEKNSTSNLRSLQSIISKEMNVNNIHDNDKPTLPSLLSNKHPGMPLIEPMSPYKLGSIQFPHSNTINNNNNLSQPLNLPIPQDQSKQIVQPISSPIILSGTKRKADSPDKPFFPNNINSSVVDSNILPSAKIVKKEVDDSPRPNLPHSSYDLDKDRDLNFPKSNLNFAVNSPFHVHSSNLNSNNQDGRHVVDVDDKNEFKIRYSNPQKTIDIELTHEILHKSVVCCVKFSNDGKYLATGSNRKAQIFNAVDGKKYKSFRGGAKDGDLYLRSVCFSPDGKYLACGAEDKTIKLWDIEENKLSHTFVSHTMDIYSLDYSCDGNLIVSGSGDKKVKLWDVQKGKCLFTLGSDEIGPKDGVTSVAFSPDRRTIAAGSLDRIVRLWDVETGTLLERFEGHLDSVYSVSFSVDGKSLASGSLDKTLKLWDTSEPRSRGKCRSTFIGHTDFVLSVAFSPDDKWLISGSKDRTVQFWDPRNVTSHCKLEGHKNSVISVAINPVLGKFATGSGDNKSKIWNYKVVG